jgi:hypothetical protein
MCLHLHGRGTKEHARTRHKNLEAIRIHAIPHCSKRGGHNHTATRLEDEAPATIWLSGRQIWFVLMPTMRTHLGGAAVGRRKGNDLSQAGGWL